MSSYPRYAIYYVPAHESQLYRSAAELIGYDAYSGDMLPFPDGIVEAAPDWHDLTQDPRKYGFHATLKAPFALAPGRSEADLVAAVETFAGTPRALPVIAPVVSEIDDFIAIVPAERSIELDDLAQECVTQFDGFRAPLTAEDRARRNPHALTARQIEHLDRWGYPYVMQDFRFHLTLTGRLSIARRRPVLTMLRRLARLDGETLAVDRIALCGQQDRTANFRILTHHVLRNASAE